MSDIKKRLAVFNNIVPHRLRNINAEVKTREFESGGQICTEFYVSVYADVEPNSFSGQSGGRS